MNEGTYGKIIEDKVAQALNTYNLLNQRPIEGYNVSPRDAAIHNLKMDIWVATQALKEVESIIDAMEERDEN